MKVWWWLDDRVANVERALLIATLCAMIGLSVMQIMLRNVWGTSLFWIDPFTRLLVLWLAVLGAMVATRSGEHLSINVVQHYLNGWAALVVARIALGFAALVCALMAWHSLRFVWDEIQFNASAFANLPAWPFQLIMPLGFAWMALRFAMQTGFGVPNRDE
ncbi:MAG: TRAP transporter small permease [Saccharospirillum sp.]